MRGWRARSISCANSFCLLKSFPGLILGLVEFRRIGEYTSYGTLPAQGPSQKLICKIQGLGHQPSTTPLHLPLFFAFLTPSSQQSNGVELFSFHSSPTMAKRGPIFSTFWLPWRILVPKLCLFYARPIQRRRTFVLVIIWRKIKFGYPNRIMCCRDKIKSCRGDKRKSRHGRR